LKQNIDGQFDRLCAGDVPQIRKEEMYLGFKALYLITHPVLFSKKSAK
jgi:hypothetical protein